MSVIKKYFAGVFAASFVLISGSFAMAADAATTPAADPAAVAASEIDEARLDLAIRAAARDLDAQYAQVGVVTVPGYTVYRPFPVRRPFLYYSRPTVSSYTTYYAPAPAVTTYYAPAPSTTTYYAPAPSTTTYYAPPVTTYSPPVTTYYAPAYPTYTPSYTVERPVIVPAAPVIVW